MIARDRLFIGGEWRRPHGSGSLDVISPTTERLIGRVPLVSTADIDDAVEVAQSALAQSEWITMSVAERASHLRRLGDELAGVVEELASLQIDEMGGPRQFIGPSTMALPRSIEREIGHASDIVWSHVRDGIRGPVRVIRSPVGVVAGVIPWNAPLHMMVAKMAPALLMGCPIIMKPAPETPLSALAFADALERADFPRGLVSILPAGREAGEYLVAHKGVDKVTFTGSSAAGRRVAEVCGHQLKPVTLELGGKSAAIVLDDADLDRFTSTIVSDAMRNNGQICVATTRVLVSGRRRDELVDRLVAEVSSMTIGDPQLETTHFGPLVAERQRDRVEEYIASGIDEGAKLVLGGGRPPIDSGWYVEPTVFSGVSNSMRIAEEEIFGPVLSVIPYRTETDAINLANDSQYGLGGAVFSSDVEHALSVATLVNTGTCAINEAPMGGGGGPGGGRKASGMGIEHDVEGMLEFLALQSISLPA